jgi:SPP1 family predicted phage head-tail adaptor
MPDPGALRELITIQGEVRTPDGGGGVDLSWSSRCRVWAEVLPARGGEQLEAAALGATTLFYVTIRWRSDVTEKDRIVRADGDLLNIRNVVDPDARRQWTRITAERGVAT